MNNLRPKYHITALKNWINDPNGVVKYKDKYHVFFQHHPFSLDWGSMHWGHVVSSDLLHWEHLPHALAPGGEGDKDHCFSGSSIVVGDRLYLIYTGLILDEDPTKIKQQQCLAYSDDGVNFHKLGLIIGEDNLPKEYSICDFRDPSVYEEDGYYYMLVAAKRKEGRGNILKYRSKDLLSWEYITDILKKDSSGVMVECPDFVKDLNLLIRSEQFQPLDGYMHHNIHSTFYDIGEFDKNHKFNSKYNGTIDYGFDMYAPQVIKGENILIGWMNMWDRNNPSREYGFSGSLTIPRILSIKDNILRQTPVMPKFVTLENDENHYQEHTRHGFYKLEIEQLKDLTINFRKGKDHVTTFTLNDSEFIFDRSKSGVEISGVEKDEDSLAKIRRIPYLKEKIDEIYLVIDEFSVEIFVNGLSLTSLIYPDLEDDLLEINITAKKHKLVKYSD